MSWAAQWFDRAGVLGLGWILGLGFGPEERAGRAGLLAGFLGWVGVGFGLVWVSSHTPSILFLTQFKPKEFK